MVGKFTNQPNEIEELEHKVDEMLCLCKCDDQERIRRMSTSPIHLTGDNKDEKLLKMAIDLELTDILLDIKDTYCGILNPDENIMPDIMNNINNIFGKYFNNIFDNTNSSILSENDIDQITDLLVDSVKSHVDNDGKFDITESLEKLKEIILSKLGNH